MSSAPDTDVLIIGGGPAGAAAGWWLATAGHRVTIVDRARFPRGKTCGGFIGPRAIVQLRDMGLAGVVDGAHRITEVRATGFGRERELAIPSMPSHPVLGELPRFGVVVRRRWFDEAVVRHVAAAGAALLEQHEAVEPIVERGFVRGAVVRTGRSRRPITASYVVLADGANSRLGRAIGTFRHPDLPYAVGARGYWRTPRHDDGCAEVVFGLEDRNGLALPAFGWVFPLGDGTANVGVRVLSTARDFKGVNPAQLLGGVVDRLADRWGFDPAAPLAPISTNRIPLGGSVDPTAGPTFLAVGDAAGLASPFDGAGLGAAYESGRLAAEVLHEALDSGDAAALQRYPKLLDDRFEDHHRAGRFLARLLGRPVAARGLGCATVRSRALLGALLRIDLELLRPHERGITGLVHRTLSAAAKAAPGS